MRYLSTLNLVKFKKLKVASIFAVYARFIPNTIFPMYKSRFGYPLRVNYKKEVLQSKMTYVAQNKASLLSGSKSTLFPVEIVTYHTSCLIYQR